MSEYTLVNGEAPDDWEGSAAVMATSKAQWLRTYAPNRKRHLAQRVVNQHQQQMPMPPSVQIDWAAAAGMSEAPPLSDSDEGVEPPSSEDEDADGLERAKVASILEVGLSDLVPAPYGATSSDGQAEIYKEPSKRLKGRMNEGYSEDE